MARKYLHFMDPMKCSGCRVCQLVCSFTYFKLVSPDRGALVIERLKDGRDMVYPCRQCEKPLCVEACKPKALSKNEKTGIVFLDAKKCVACGACVAACSYKGIKQYSKNCPPVKCIACGACVSWCPDKVLEIVNQDENVAGGA